MYEAHSHCRNKKGLWRALIGTVTQGEDGRHLSSTGEGKVSKPLEGQQDLLMDGLTEK